jgi:hypothetical protein
MNDYPYAPSLEMYREWQREADHNERIFLQVAAMAAKWGADQELKACCEALDNLNDGYWSEKLRTARRPKITENQ